ncbi:hypothetical protein HAX54_001654 [Datura stramonium]|uniref:Acid phosphatase n=1 Tax=Datura stramonium TaxID=4076 RepID=A0ABS8T3D0_DATST|nr:hypothetical protein [Datura stramonium]
MSPPKCLDLFSNNTRGDKLYCESWRFTVETNSAGNWDLVPKSCVDFVEKYMTCGQYLSDLEAVSYNSLQFAKSLKLDDGDGGKDVWIFDIDETLLSNAPFFAAYGWGSEPYEEETWIEWQEEGLQPALPASLNLYKELQQLGFNLILLSGRYEYQRNSTDKNLQLMGYTNWGKLILRDPSEADTPATIYKSQKRKELEDEGYKIWGSSGDQWSDLMGFSLAKRSFKLPNLMYYVA